jgi:hypothetical protein
MGFKYINFGDSGNPLMRSEIDIICFLYSYSFDLKVDNFFEYLSEFVVLLLNLFQFFSLFSKNFEIIKFLLVWKRVSYFLYNNEVFVWLFLGKGIIVGPL